MKILACATLLAAISTAALAKEPDPKIVQKELGDVISAVFKADMEPIEKHTHERVFAIVGDKKTFLAEIEKAFKGVQEAGVVLIRAEVGEKLDYFKGKENEFFFVSTNIVMKVGDKEPQMVPGYQLGVKKTTETVWKYIDCSSLTVEMAREWFPDFPKDKKLPVPGK